MSSLPRRDRLTFLAAVALSIATGVMHVTDAPPLATFIVAAIALAGLASVVSFATEAIGEAFGPAVTGVLQSTLGNLPELFIVLFALSAGEVVVAQTSIIGSLFANALLVLGIAIVVGARRERDGVMRFHRRLPNDTSTLLLLAVFIIALLGLSAGSSDRASNHATAISVAGAVVLLLVYGVWLSGYLRGSGAAARPVEGAGVTERGPGLVSAEERKGMASAGGEERAHVPLRPAIVMLAVSGVFAAGVSDWFVAALSPAADQIGISRAFVGLVIVAIAGNAVENATGVVLAAKGKSDLAISVVNNSVAQIAVFLFPVIVLISQAFATPLTFALAPVYIGALLLMALAVWQITGDGEAVAFEGAALIGLYLILAIVAFYE